MRDARQARFLVLVLVLTLAAWGDVRADADDEAEYVDCLDQARRVPSAAYERALAWRDEGGGFPARHCAALALINLDLFPDAARRLERLAEDMQRAGQAGVAAVLGQAGNAWLLGGYANRAESVLSAALEVVPDDPELLIDRARAFAAVEKHEAAAADLDRALALAPNNVDALVFRASARRQLGALAGASTDLNRALSLAPENPEALLERGLLAMARGEPGAAREALVSVLRIAPGSPAADTAAANLQRLDLKRE